MRICKKILVCAVALIWLSVGSSYDEQGGAVKEITAEQKEKAHAILKQALAIAEKQFRTGTKAEREEDFDIMNTLPSFAVVLARIDVDEALAVIDKMYLDQMMRGIALGVILFEAAMTNKERVMEVFDRVIGTTNVLTDEAKAPGGGEFAGPALMVTSGYIAQMIGAIAKTDIDLSLAITDKIKDDEMSKFMRWLTLVHIAGAIAKTDTDRALAIASKIEDDNMKSLSLIYVAGEIAENNKERAQAILDKALEIIAKQPFDEVQWLLFDSPAMFDVPSAMAKVNPDKAVSLAANIKMEEEKKRALTQIVVEVARTNPSKALEIAHSEAYAPARAQMLIQIGSITAKTAPNKALAIVDEIEKMKYIEAKVKAQRAVVLSTAAVEVAKSDKQQGLVLLEQALAAAGEERQILENVVVTAAQIDVDRAVGIAEKMENPSERGRTLHSIATVVAETNSDKALMIAEKIEEGSVKAQALGGIAASVAKTNLDKALMIAEKIEEGSVKAQALGGVAASVAETNPDKALMIAEKMEEDSVKAQALCNIADTILKIVEWPPSVDYAMETLMVFAAMYAANR